MSGQSRKRELEHSLDIEDHVPGSSSITNGTKRRLLLPSPSTSCSAEPEIAKPVPFPRPRIYKRSRSAPGNIETLAGERFSDTDHTPRRDKIISDHIDGVHNTPSNQIAGEDTEIGLSVAHWANTGRWPENFASMSQKRSDSQKKRSRSSSYSQSFKDGDVPRAHSQAYEKVLAENGVYMEELKGRSLVTKESKVLSAQLLQSRHAEPQHTTFPLSEFLPVWQRAQNRNEARIYRDITQVLVPSPELLWLCGAQELEDVAEEIGAEWSKCQTLGGPKPKPDFAVGISTSAFSEEEVAKLKNHTAAERPTMFTDNLYFPFLLCEVKCGNEGINRADRQNMHSSSLAVKAIVELFLALGDNQAIQLSGQILVFSVSHDNERVKLYGHFPILERDRIAFYRYPIATFDLNFEESQGRKRTHDFVRTIYGTFFQEHVNRIRDVLAKMEDPRSRSIYSDMSVEESESQEETPSAQSSQELVGFKKPDAPASKKQKREVALLRELLAEQQRQSKEQLAEQQRQSKEQLVLLERQLEEQRKQNEAQRKQNEAQRKQSEEQRKQSEEQRKQSEEQRKQSEEQRKQSEEQRKQNEEQIKMLRQLLDRP